METISNLWTDNRRRVLAWFQDDVFRRLCVNAGKLLSANVVGAVLGLIAAVLTARALGPQNYGILALVMVYELTIGKLVTFNAWEAVIKFGSEALHADDRAGLRQLVKFGFALDIASAIVGTVLAMALAGPVIGLLGWDASVRPLLVLYSVLILFSLSGTPIGVLRLFDRFDLLGYTAILSSVVRLAGVFWCLVTRQALLGFVAVYLVTGIIGQLYQIFASLWVLKKQNITGIVAQPWRGIRGRFPGIADYVWTTNVNSTIRMLSREGDELVVAGLTTPAALGLFKVAKQFSHILPRLLDPLYHSIYPEFTRFAAAGKKCAFLSLLRRATLFVSVLALGGWFLFLLSGRWFVTSTVGTDYSQTYVVAAVYMLALIILIGGFALAPAMLSLGHPRRSLGAVCTATAVYFIALVPLVSCWGISGAAIAYVIFALIWLLMMLLLLQPSLHKTTNWNQ
jgi:O-antigen/teichoic acid export membrane protein